MAEQTRFRARPLATAIVLVSLLGLSLAVRTGAPGQPKPVTQMFSAEQSGTVTIGSNCTNYASITVSVPSAGRLVVSSMAWLSVNHFEGQGDRVFVSLNESPTGCDDFGPWAWADELGITFNNANYVRTANVQSVFAISAGGTYTYYLNAYMFIGQDAYDEIRYSNTVAVFYAP